MFQKYSSALSILALIVSFNSFSKDYRDVKVGKFERSFDISECGNNTFLSFMKSTIYDAIKEEAGKQRARDHFKAVEAGEGVEIKLTDNVTTYHVKYKMHDEKNAERSGRSYAAVGLARNGVADYLADASDKFYLDSLEDIAQDKRELAKFYRTIFGVIAKCDASGFDSLREESQRVAADFVAVYVAEQYRHMIGGRGELGRTFNWDDALLQVTMLASFHSGQDADNGGMFYEGRFTDAVFNQVNKDKDGVSHCVYRQYKDESRDLFERRESRLNDYWQMNRECKRSGINMTRSDFSKMAKAVTEYAAENFSNELDAVNAAFNDEGSQDVYKTVSKFFINNSAPDKLGRRADKMIDALVDFLMAVRENANDLTNELKN